MYHFNFSIIPLTDLEKSSEIEEIAHNVGLAILWLNIWTDTIADAAV